MHITCVYIEGFKRFAKFTLELSPTFNVIVGDNETGKSSVLESIGLVLTGQYDGRLIQYAIDPYLFNAAAVADYFQRRQSGVHCPPPRILIEAYLHPEPDNPALASLRGTNNSRGEDCPGLALTIEVDSAQAEALRDYAADKSNPKAYGTDALNFGLSKGLQFDRVLIVPTGPMKKYLKTGVLSHVEKARDKLHVAITRARHSAAFVFDDASPVVPKRWPSAGS